MRINISDAKAGMTISEDIIKSNASVTMLGSDIQLTDSLIEALKRNGIQFIDVKLTRAQELAYIADKGVTTTISNNLKEEAKTSIKEFNLVGIIKNAKAMISSILSNDDFRYSLSEYKNTKDIFSHSIRVAAFSILLARYYNETLPNFINDPSVLEKCTVDLNSIAIAAMLHDIGKLCQDKNTLSVALSHKEYMGKFFPSIKTLDLDNYNESFTSIYSYLLLMGNKQLDNGTMATILLSNENETGPSNLNFSEEYLSSRQNFIFASKIIKLCSMYDDELKIMISENASLENISAKLDYSASNGIVNEELEKLFIDHIPLYSKGVKVKLSDGRFAIVNESFHGRANVCKPIVITLPDVEVIDLRTTTTLTIQEICSDEISFMEIVNMQLDTMEEELAHESRKK